MSPVPIVELLAYTIIGMAALLILGGVAFLFAINVYERIEGWRVDAKARKATARDKRSPSVVPRSA